MPRGGARPGAGRPRKDRTASATAPESPAPDRSTPEVSELTPLEYFLAIMNNPAEPAKRRDWAAAQAAPYLHRRSAEDLPGKRQQAQDAAEEAARGRFAPRSPPRLVVSNA